uniref:Pentatricopeptide repeat-containing protein 1 n=1 Tax=Apis cerana TaxID=7461 RepID=V9IEN1_APICE
MKKSEIDISNTNELLSKNLNNILKENRFLLFGGIDKFLKRMKSDDVKPDLKTTTLILDLLPSTIEAEQYYLKYVISNNFKIDITFFNMLIKRRCLRKQYNAAKDVLNEIQNHHFTPNIITFGVLAIGCIRCRDGIELLEQMDTIGYAPNFIVLETLFFNACRYKNFVYILHLMEYILHNNVIPTKTY